MCSHQLCEKYLQLLFTVLEKSADMAVRANTIVAAGDLAFRYPNLTEPWTPHLYARLQDPAPLVRKNTIIVLTHLILNDMIKVKGQISEMALVLEDKDESIAANARFFFSQLAKKGNDIYNVLPNIISHLSDPQRLVPREKFRNITRFLFSFVQKDKHCESLVEKICHRFRATGSEQQWRDLAHCLTQINFNDRCVRKLQDNFTCYQDKLVDRDVYTSFTSVTNKAKKFAKPETKALITELEEMMKTAQQKGLEELEDEREGEGDGEESEKKREKEENGRNASLSPPPIPLSRKKAKTTSKKASKQLRLQTPAKGRTEKVKSKVRVGTTRRLKALPVALESDEEKENSEWNEDDDFRTDVLTSARRAVANSGSITRRRPVRRVRGQKIRQLVFSSDEDEQSER
ncbi:Condensin complex subunit 1, partial [Geodia barretti]